MSRIVVVTGTDTGVGKTVAVAALAAACAAKGRRVLAVKPVQTGIDSSASAGDPADADEVRRLTGCATRELVRLAAPLAPDTAARLAGVDLPPVEDHVARIVDLARDHDTVIVEGAGGVMVRLDDRGATLLDLAARVGEWAPGGIVDVVVVCRAGLGTLNHTELTVEALRGRGIEPAGLVIGSWPDEPGLAEETNLRDLPRGTGVPVVAVIPAGAGALAREEFLDEAPGWFTPTRRAWG
ncbi:ATP-dependent dethiobiotin synthetase BioD [Nocardioides sp. GY 10113]|uniref:dethiobiotin synthase n=1 Tax=Nocardioides sp. GY 10113 TaxID=2569761 RepID=UPI0010A80486|nr:dethiobiotin synthase [Nocardioides sp. GY 10113]TIC88017.1 ATP-dependent dethiobiotin synthetase BioD [Nocardioides sp. GY 10113]